VTTAASSSLPSPPILPPTLEEGRFTRVLLSLVVLAVLVAATLGLWRLQVARDRQDSELEMADTAQDLAHRAAALLKIEIDRVESIASRVRNRQINSQEEFDRAATEVTGNSTAIRSIAFLDPTETCLYAWSRDADEQDLIPGRALSKVYPWTPGLDRGREEKLPWAGPLSRHGSRALAGIVLPIFSGEGSLSAYKGAVSARLDISAALSSIKPPSLYNVDISQNSVAALQQGDAIDENAPNVETEAIAFVNRFYRLRLAPNLDAAEIQGSRKATMVLWIGLLCSMALAGTVHIMLKRRAVAAVEARRELAAVESMIQTAGVITLLRTTDTAALDRLADSARRLLGVDRASIALVNQRDQTLEPAGRAGFDVRTNTSRYPIAQTPTVRRCMSERRVIEVTDVAADPNANRQYLQALRLGGCLFVPLIVEDRALGVLLVGDAYPRRFTDGEIHLARALGAQISVILANEQLQREKDAALAAQRTLADQREALFQISRDIYESENVDEALQRLSDNAPKLVGVDLCAVHLFTHAPMCLRVAAITGNFAQVRGDQWNAAGTNAQRVIETGQSAIVTDAPADPAVHPAFKHRLHIGAMMLLPLTRQSGTPLGVISLIRHDVGPFTEEQLAIANVLAARASSAIETASLHDAVRQNLRTQEMLLRELNHRVKNNLASIVTLLSIHRPAMAQDVEDWLNRLTDRVATMARTHELFVGGKDSVSLVDLVNKLLPALTVIKPPQARIETDLDGVNVQFDTERAVSLAMVLNELCWNALEHGLSDTGTMCVRARMIEPAQLTLEVEDDGGGKPNPAAPLGTHRGMGLRLIEGLVSRELHGKFNLSTLPHGGTLAHVEIPLDNSV
jgi:two-component sensor histidine kinase/sensor domain CHASE-containing protein